MNPEEKDKNEEERRKMMEIIKRAPLPCQELQKRKRRGEIWKKEAKM